MRFRVSAEQIIDRLGIWLPWPRRAHTCYFNLRPGNGGPRIFAEKLIREFDCQDIKITHNRLRSAQAALLFSISPGDWFYSLARLWETRTVLRVDGFPVPAYFDNRSQPPLHQDRRLTLERIALNHRLQRDLSMADHVIYQSRFSKQMADHFLYTRQDNYSIVFNGVDLEVFRPTERNNQRKRILIAGSLRHEYILGTVLPVFEQLLQKNDLEMVIVGSMDEICVQHLSNFRRSVPEAAKRIEVTEWVPNTGLPAIMQQADLYIHPRLGDWCPNTLIEAMACGLPVVCGSWGGQAELVGNGGVVVSTGEWTYDKEYVSALTQGVQKVLGNLDQYQIAARSRAEALFDIHAVARQYASLLGLSVTQVSILAND